MNPTRHKGTTFVSEFRLVRLTRDLRISRKFYEEIFDWPVVNEWDQGVMYNTGSAILEIIQEAQAQEANQSSRIAILVPDVWSLFEKIKDKVPLVFPIRDNAWGDTSFRILDPEGFPITLFTLTKK